MTPKEFDDNRKKKIEELKEELYQKLLILDVSDQNQIRECINIYEKIHSLVGTFRCDLYYPNGISMHEGDSTIYEPRNKGYYFNGYRIPHKNNLLTKILDGAL
jgi:hypothetical protein